MGDTDLIATLERWRDAGGYVRLSESEGADAVLELCSCEGQAFDRFTVRPETLARLREAIDLE